MLSVASSVLQAKGVRLIVIAIGPKSLMPEYRKVLDDIAGKELFFAHDYNELEETVSNITALICRKYN